MWLVRAGIRLSHLEFRRRCVHLVQVQILPCQYIKNHKEERAMKFLDKLFKKSQPVEQTESKDHTHTETEDRESEIQELRMLSEDSWFGEIARKHHG